MVAWSLIISCTGSDIWKFYRKINLHKVHDLTRTRKINWTKYIHKSKENSARNYRPCFRENQPIRSFSIKWKRAFWACFRENWVYKFGHRWLKVNRQICSFGSSEGIFWVDITHFGVITHFGLILFNLGWYDTFWVDIIHFGLILHVLGIPFSKKMQCTCPYIP